MYVQGGPSMMWFFTLSRLARSEFDISRSLPADLVALAKGQLISKAIYGIEKTIICI